MLKKATHSTIPVETSSKNKYLYDRKLKKTILSHPILFFLAKIKLEGKDIKKWLDSQTGSLILIPELGSFQRNEINYYIQKILFLEANGFFKEIEQDRILTRKLTEENISHKLANLKQITFELTDSCQMNCYYCGYGALYNNYEPRENKMMDFLTAQQAIDYIHNMANSSLNVSHKRDLYMGFYGGEPLLNFSLIRKIVEYVNQLYWKHNTIRFTITTNGLLLDKYMDFIKENNFSIYISLDGDEFNSQYRVLKNGNSTFEKIIKNVELLRVKYPNYFKEWVFFNAVLHNKNSVEALFNFFTKKFDKYPNILTLNTRGIREERIEEFKKTFVKQLDSLYNSKDYTNIEKEMFVKLASVRSVTNFIFSSIDFWYDDYTHFFNSEIISNRFPSGTCIPFDQKMFITVKGKILACERIGQEYILGCITSEGVQLDFKNITNRYNKWYDKIRNKCEICYIFNQCFQCLFYLDLSKDKPLCSNFMDLKAFAKSVAFFFDYFEKRPNLFDRILKEVLIG